MNREQKRPAISLKASIEVMVYLPAGCRIWATPLTPDFDTKEARCVIHIDAEADTELIARDLVRLALERIAAAALPGTGIRTTE